jgi:hypothetical protein
MRCPTLPRWFLAALLLAAVPAGAAVAQPPSPSAEPPRVRASRIAEPPAIDGRLDEAAWAAAEAVGGLIQREPDEGAPTSEETEVRVLYDAEALYVGARLADSRPPSTRLGRRDDFLDSDWFQLWLDPHLDRQSGAGFWVNPSNVQIDMTLFNDTWNDWSWDAVWSSATSIDAGGWTVEMRIPYSQLRFPHREEHVWGIDVGRIIQRNNEQAYLVHVPRTETGFVSRFARLTEIEGIRPPRSLELVPYAVSRADLRGTVDSDHPFTSSTEADASAGLDVKVGLTTNLTLTGTINPDFGQVEVDPAVVNLSQFETFFPEKRPFFIEGAANFRFGRGASNNSFGFNYFRPDFFYTRRIGRQPQLGIGGDFVDVPGETTILGAAKLTGKTEGGWTIGVLDAFTDEETGRFTLDGVTGRAVAEPRANYFVSRIAREPSERSRVGMLFTAVNRDTGDELRGLHREAYTGGLDGHRFFGDKDVIWEWFVGGSLVRGSREAIAATQAGPAHEYDRPDAGHVRFDPGRTALDGWSAGTMLAKQTGKWRYNLKVESYSPGFDTNDVGFMTRTDLVASHAVVLYFDPEPHGRVRTRSFWLGKYQNWNHDGDLIANGIYGNASAELTSYWDVYAWGGAGAATDDDRLTRGGPVARTPAGTNFGVGFSSDDRKRLILSAEQGNSFDDEGGFSHSGYVGLRFKPTSNLSLSISPSYSRSRSAFQFVTRAADPLARSTFGARYVFAEIDRETIEIGTRLDWTFTPRLSLQLYLQPFVASGDYHGFKELARPRSLDATVYGVDAGTIAEDDGRFLVDPDGPGPAAPFTFGDPDFNFRSLRGSAVLRWEFRPGSAAYLVWNENRADVARLGDFSVDRDFSALASAPADDVFLLKISYWLGM